MHMKQELLQRPANKYSHNIEHFSIFFCFVLTKCVRRGTYDTANALHKVVNMIQTNMNKKTSALDFP